MRYQLLGGFRMSCGRSSCYQPLCFLPDVACAPQVGHLKATCKKGSGPAKSIKKTKSVKPEKRAPAVRILPIPACVCARLLFGVCVCVCCPAIPWRCVCNATCRAFIAPHGTPDHWQVF